MAQKNATPDARQMKLIRASGRNPHEWVVVRETNLSMFIRHRVTNLVELIDKRRLEKRES